MKTFMDPDFLLQTETARHLFHDYAESLPIFDYHCHISPKEIYEDIHYDNITQVWLYGDHYKWRIMRAVGTPEELITGNGSDYDKFLAYAKALSQAIGNPLYHWSHLELKHYFGIDEPLNEASAPRIWEQANARLRELSCRDLIRMSNVALIGTTDDPIDDLRYHKLIAEEGAMSTTVVPAFRPDRMVEITKPDFADYIAKLSEVVGYPIESLGQLAQAAKERVEYFHARGSRISDHGLDYAPFQPATEAEVDAVFRKALRGGKLTSVERDQYRTWLLILFAKEYEAHDWTMQLHMAAIRNVNSRLFNKLGPDCGNDAILDVHLAERLGGLLDTMQSGNRLPKTVLYSLNPNDNYTLLTIGGCFAGETAGRIQLGSAWWFNDHIDGMRQQLRTFANVGVLGQFIGMLTDSRSFLSYYRHEYFRRIVCDLIGTWVEDGDYPQDEVVFKDIVTGICYNNAVRFFNIALK